jgi:methionyl-tRNA formyltransferase
MRIGWIGFHMEGVPALREVLARGYPVMGILTLTQNAADRRSGAADYTSIGREFCVPVFEVDDINGDVALGVLAELNLDLGFCIGWTQLIGPAAREHFRLGIVGAHASLLPHNRGRAPVNWALIRGEKETGNTLQWLGDSVDGGDVIDQRRIPVTPYDTCESIYERVAESNRDMILELLPRLMNGERPATPQLHSDEELLPRRRPADGEVDWSTDSSRVYDFVRALTRPYPGAFGWFDDRRWTIWSCALPPAAMAAEGAPGEVIGAVVSPVDQACGQTVRCGDGAITLLELEDENGLVLKGRELSDQRWQGRRWRNGA